MSRTAAPPAGAAAGNPSRAAVFRWWHASCILFGTSGCYYFLPLAEEQPNVPPVITDSFPSSGDPWVLEPGVNTAFVRVLDENDADRLEYFWTVTNLGEQGTATPITGNENGSWLTLEGDPLYDGRVLRCRVIDSFGESDEAEWPLSVPWESR
jgi:hypothetical protein